MRKPPRLGKGLLKEAESINSGAHTVLGIVCIPTIQGGKPPYIRHGLLP